MTSNRVTTLPPPEAPLSFEEWQETVSRHFPDLAFPAEVGLSVISQLLINNISNPFALVLVDVPSSGKTMTINLFDGIPELTYTSDKFSPASFVSSAASRSLEQLAKIDLLPRIKHKMLLLRDLGPTFASKDDHLKELLGTMTRVLDGEGLSVDTGVHGSRGYSGEFLFMLLGAVTPLSPNVWKVMSQLGSRLFFLNMGTREKSTAELAAQLTKSEYRQSQTKCSATTRQFLQTLWNKYPSGIDWDSSKDDVSIIEMIVYCAKMLAKLRGAINVWKEYGPEVPGQFAPIVERPDRISQLLYNLARGHAVAQGRTQLTVADMKPVIELMIDSAPTNRSKIFRKLLNNGGWITTTEVKQVLRCTHPTAIKEMEAMAWLLIGEVKQGGLGQVGGQEKWFLLDEDHEWFACNHFRQVWSGDTQPLVPFHDDTIHESEIALVRQGMESSGVAKTIKESNPEKA